MDFKIIILIVLSPLVISFILLRIFKNKLNNSETKENTRFYFEYFGFVTTMVAILIALYSIYQSKVAFDKSNEDSLETDRRSRKSDSLSDAAIQLANKTNEQLILLYKEQKNLSDKLKELPKEVDNFSKSIKNLNLVISVQQDKFAKNINLFSNNLNSLNQNINNFSNSLIDYKDQLNRITQTTENQLNIVREQQKLIAEEMTKDADILISPECELQDSIIYLKAINLKVTGNVDIEHGFINIKIFNKNLLTFTSQFFNILTEDKESTTYSSNFEKIILGTELRLFLIARLSNDMHKILYVVAFQTRNNKSHVKYGEFYISKESCIK